jgi:hypothetical protein
MTLQLSIVPTSAYREILRSLIGKPLKSIPFSVKAGGLHFNNEISSFNGEHIFIPIELYGAKTGFSLLRLSFKEDPWSVVGALPVLQLAVCKGRDLYKFMTTFPQPPEIMLSASFKEGTIKSIKTYGNNVHACRVEEGDPCHKMEYQAIVERLIAFFMEDGRILAITYPYLLDPIHGFVGLIFDSEQRFNNYRSDAPGDYGDPLFELIEVYE